MAKVHGHYSCERSAFQVTCSLITLVVYELVYARFRFQASQTRGTPSESALKNVGGGLASQPLLVSSHACIS